MSNDCCGTLKVVAKDKMTLKRLLDILKYDDGEYCLYRCKDADWCGEPYEDDGYWVQDFVVDGAWSCKAFFDHGDKPECHLEGYARKEDGSLDFDHKIEKPPHFTDLTHLAKVLDFGCELFACESGCEFCEHATVNHKGEFSYDSDYYHLNYPIGEDGEPDLDKEPEEEFGLSDYMEFGWSKEIYGEGD